MSFLSSEQLPLITFKISVFFPYKIRPHTRRLPSLTLGVVPLPQFFSRHFQPPAGDFLPISRALSYFSKAPWQVIPIYSSATSSNTLKSQQNLTTFPVSICLSYSLFAFLITSLIILKQKEYSLFNKSLYFLTSFVSFLSGLIFTLL